MRDADAIAAVHVAAWDGAYRGLVPDPVLDNMSVPERSQRWRDALTNGDLTWVAVDREAVIGFARIGLSEVEAIYVHPAHQGRGGGSLLLAQAERALAENGSDATLWVLAANTATRQWYENRGWHHDGATDTYGELGSVARYRKALGSMP